MLTYCTYFSGDCVELNNQWLRGHMIFPLDGYIYCDGDGDGDFEEIKLAKKLEDNLKDVAFIPRYTSKSNIKKCSSELPLKLHFEVNTRLFKNKLTSYSVANAIGELSYEIIVELYKFDEEHEVFVGRILEHPINDKECESYGS